VQPQLRANFGTPVNVGSDCRYLPGLCTKPCWKMLGWNCCALF